MILSSKTYNSISYNFFENHSYLYQIIYVSKQIHLTAFFFWNTLCFPFVSNINLLIITLKMRIFFVKYLSPVFKIKLKSRNIENIMLSFSSWTNRRTKNLLYRQTCKESFRENKLIEKRACVYTGYA